MIRKQDFIRLKFEVDTALNEAFEKAKANQKNEGDYILFLANAENVSRYHEHGNNPHVLDYRIFGHRDSERLTFLTEYLRNVYSFNAENTADSKTSLAIELMIYTHLWESKTFLRQMKKLVNLCVSENYDWDIQIPDYTKHTYIREELRDKLTTASLKLGGIVSNGYHSSLRNAFSHSEFYFDMNKPKFHLTNYGGKEWEIKEITFDEWTIRFCYSFLLSYGFQEKFEKEKSLLEVGAKYNVTLKDEKGQGIPGFVTYDSERDSFMGTILTE